ncbi:MAG: ATP-binding protein [Chloroflexi bacterium]|nr:ATP-binding protein [Chloroflexota bacterium]
MNSFYSTTELEYYPRWLTSQLQAAVSQHPVVVLTGARQVGKSTLLRNAAPFAVWNYYTLDDYDVLHQVQRDPKALWAGASNIVLDEVQKAPQLLSAIKLAVDQAKGRLRFVLSGSANLLLMQHVSESLAGRAIYFALQPMTFGETQRKPAPTILGELLAGSLPARRRLKSELPDLLPLLLRGWMPVLLRLNAPQAVLQWWEGYIATYLERDLRQISQIESLADFRRVMQLLALRTGQLLNQSEVARDAALSQPTTHRYINLLETTYLVQRIPAFTASRTTRLLKAPKIHWTDSGLAIYLAGYFDVESLQRARELGNLYETFVIQHLRVLAELETPRA